VGWFSFTFKHDEIDDIFIPMETGDMKRGVKFVVHWVDVRPSFDQDLDQLEVASHA
jgi:hypothetical protein